LFSFKLASSPKTLSVCVSKTQPDYIVYRFGTKDKIKLEFPENKADSWSKFTYSYYLRGGGAENEGMDLNYLSFENGGGCLRMTVFLFAQKQNFQLCTGGHKILDCRQGGVS
jgi:hypothetical protein